MDEERLRNLERRVNGMEIKYSNMESAIQDLRIGIQKINDNIGEIKELLAKQAVVNDYMKEIFVSKEEFQKTIGKLSDNLAALKSDIESSRRTSNSFWSRYGYVIATVAVIVSLIGILVRLYHGGG